jgi:hypothetical protein
VTETLLIYFGLLTAVLGGVSLIKPVKFLKIRSRWCGALVLGLGAAAAIAGLAFPNEEYRIATPRTQLDQFAPLYEFNEFHSIRVAAPRDRVYLSMKMVTADEIPLFRTLTWIRRGGRGGPESILNPNENVPILEVATRTAFLVLAENSGREIVLGTAVMVPADFRATKRLVPDDFRAIQQQGFAIAMMNFLIEDDGQGACIISTETRVRATDPSAKRRFAAYWRMIYPGSALIRRMWLRAIKKRAEGSSR